MTAPEGPAQPDVVAFRRSLRGLFADLDADLATLGPACAASGRCCRFAEYGHTLFLSAPEVDFLIDEAPPPVRPLDDGSTCPWQDALGRCTAREARPLGCRVYFCDPNYQDSLFQIGESYIARLKSMVAKAVLPWDYAPLHRHLRVAIASGTLETPPTLDRPD